MDIVALRKERSENITENAGDFQLNAMLLDLVDGSPKRAAIHKIEVLRVEDGQAVVFDQVEDESGRKRQIRCSNVMIRVNGGQEL